MKLRATNSGAGWQHEVCEDKPKIRINSLCMTLVMRRKYLIAWAWIFSVILGVWLINSFHTVENCSRGNKIQPESKKVQLIRVNDDPTLLNTQHLEETSIDEKNLVKRDRNMPIIFVGGVPRSGTTLMRAMLDAHPGIRCGEETRIVPRMIDMRHAWSQAPKEAERLQNAGITDELIDSALSAFILEIIVNHGKQADHLCNKDPLVLRHSVYVKTKLFPNARFILMIRDGRASVHSMMSRKVTIKNFNLNSWHDCLSKWNMMIEKMYEECMELGPETCLPVYYEQLVLHPESTMRKILLFLEIPWNDAVIHHEKFIGDEILLSKIEFSTDQVVKPVNLDALTSWVGKIPQDIMENMDTIAPMLGRLGYDPMANPPKYGEADLKIKENTENIRKNPEFWKKMEKKYSNLVLD